MQAVEAEVNTRQRATTADVVFTDATTDVDLDDFSLKKFLFYRTSKFAMVIVWQLGLVHRFCQLGLFGYVLYTLLGAAQWASTSPIVSNVNVWISPGNAPNVSAANMPYCNDVNDAYDYVYDFDFEYTSPFCRREPADAISEKEPARIFVTTQYTETTTVGWNCAAAGAAASVAACDARSGTLLRDGAQCGCETRSTIFPLGVEAMRVSFTHSYTMSEIDMGGKPIRGGEAPLTLSLTLPLTLSLAWVANPSEAVRRPSP